MGLAVASVATVELVIRKQYMCHKATYVPANLTVAELCGYDLPLVGCPVDFSVGSAVSWQPLRFPPYIFTVLFLEVGYEQVLSESVDTRFGTRSLGQAGQYL